MTPAGYVTIATALNSPQDGRLDRVLDAADTVGIDGPTLDDTVDLLNSNRSPCWFCGTGIGDNRVELFEPEFVYAHPVCFDNNRKASR